MKIELEFAELHNPLFLNGTNLQMKLDPKKRNGLKLIYDRAEKELVVYYRGKLAIIPSSNVSSMTPEDSEVLGKVPEEKKEYRSAFRGKVQVDQTSQTESTFERMLKGKKTAQVSSPTAHVFQEGAGKVRD